MAHRHTPGLPVGLRSFAARDHLLDLYDDEVEVLGQRIPGPTHPEALAHYRFALTGTRADGSDSLYDVSVLRRSRLRPGLVGHLVVRQRDFAMVEAGLTLAPPLVTDRAPSRDGLRLRFLQHFAAFGPDIMLPVDLDSEVEGHLGTSALRERVRRWRNDATPRARLLGRTRLAAHHVNGRVSDFVYQSPGPLEVDGLAVTDTSTPPSDAAFTPAEERAYGRLREPRSLAQSPVLALFALYLGLPAAPEPGASAEAPDPFAAESLVTGEVVEAAVAQGLGMQVPPLPDEPWVPEREPEVWYNRVEGLHAGGRARFRAYRGVGLHLTGGTAVGLERWYGGVGLSLDADRGPTLTLSRRSGARATAASATYSLAHNSFAALLGIGDYFDYYWNRAWRLEAHPRPAAGRGDVRLGLNRETHSSLAKSTDFDIVCDFQPESGHFYGWFCEDRDHDFRDNPPIRPGQLHSLDLQGRWGDPYVARGRAANRGLELATELAGGPLGGDFDFARVQLAADGHWGTYLRGRPGGGHLDLRLVGGAARGAVPPQRLGLLDAAIWRLTPFGTLRTRRDRPLSGDRYLGLFWEHDFGAAPFELLGLWGLAASGSGLLLQGASAHVWRGCGACGSGASHHELGLSWVVDGSWRLDATRRLDRPGWWVGISRARRHR